MHSKILLALLLVAIIAVPALADDYAQSDWSNPVTVDAQGYSSSDSTSAYSGSTTSGYSASQSYSAPSYQYTTSYGYYSTYYPYYYSYSGQFFYYCNNYPNYAYGYYYPSNYGYYNYYAYYPYDYSYSYYNYPSYARYYSFDYSYNYNVPSDPPVQNYEPEPVIIGGTEPEPQPPQEPSYKLAWYKY